MAEASSFFSRPLPLVTQQADGSIMSQERKKPCWQRKKDEFMRIRMDSYLMIARSEADNMCDNLVIFILHHLESTSWLMAQASRIRGLIRGLAAHMIDYFNRIVLRGQREETPKLTSTDKRAAEESPTCSMGWQKSQLHVSSGALLLTCLLGPWDSRSNAQFSLPLVSHLQLYCSSFVLWIRSLRVQWRTPFWARKYINDRWLVAARSGWQARLLVH